MRAARPRAKALTTRPKPGALPLGGESNVDPDTPLDRVEYRKAKAPFAMPAEAYNYEVMYNAFRADTEFWEKWKVVDCARYTPGALEDRAKQGNRPSIRVVMDLPPSEKVYPVAYTPCAPTVPAANSNLAAAAAAAGTQALPPASPYAGGSPRGFSAGDGALVAFQDAGSEVDLTPRDADRGSRKGASVALEVHKLEEVRRLVSWQRECNEGGQVDPADRWLEDIVNARDGAPQKALARAKHRSRPSLILTNPPGTPPRRISEVAQPLPFYSEVIEAEAHEPDVSHHSSALRGFSELYGTT